MPISGVRAGVVSGGIKDAIPDSGGTHQWDTDEGSGTTLTDNIGSLDATVNGATWTTGLGTGDTHLVYDGTDDYADLGATSTSELSHFVNSGQGTLFAWVRMDQDKQSGVIGIRPNSADKMFALRWNANNSLWEFVLGDGSGSYSVLMQGGTMTVGEWLPVAVSLNGSTATLYAGIDANDDLQQVATDTVSGTATGDLRDPVLIGAEQEAGGISNNIAGSVDLSFADDVGQSQSDLQTFVDGSIALYT